MKTLKGLALSVTTCSIVMAGGYKIPEQSLNSMGLASAYVAHTTGADTAYYNPANMSFMADKNYIEGGLTLARLPSIVYSLIEPYSGESEVENIPIPFLYYVAQPMDDFRWGISLTAPGGLTKRWEDQPQKSFAQEFTLKIIEVNPSASYKIADNFSIGGGLRLVYSEGIVKSSGSVSRDMEGDTLAFGYNLAMTYKPTNDIDVALTYRSNVDLNEEGTAKLYYGDTLVYDGDASVEVPLPATLNLAIAKTWNDQFTLEFDYERAFWSQYKNLDFEYGGASIGALTTYFDTPQARNWKDVNIFRLGATIKMDNKITAMMGLSMDDSPAPVETLGFELPDSDSMNFAMGLRYQQNESLSWGASFLYSNKEAFTMPVGVNTNPVLANGGGFSEGGAFLTTLGVAYEF